MKTEIAKIDESSLKRAKELLLSGELVAFPTETVYGLGACAFNDKAVEKIFLTKGRPQDNPLIVHIHKNYDIEKIAKITNDYSKKLLKEFTPGAITLVFKSKGVVAKNNSCGLDTLAVRIPKSKECQEFLAYVDMPISAPSANKSKHTSPVTAMHVFEDFNGEIPLILDGGRCDVGIESTVVSVVGEIPVILRPGIITREDIIKVVGDCKVVASASEKMSSPGTRYAHYMPKCETAFFDRKDKEKILSLLKDSQKKGKRVKVLCETDFATELQVDKEYIYDLGQGEIEVTKNLYNFLHLAEKECDLLIGVKVNESYDGVLNRMLKAFSNK